jgi:hypothetical protein
MFLTCNTSSTYVPFLLLHGISYIMGQPNTYIGGFLRALTIVSKEAEEVHRKCGLQNHMREFEGISTQPYPVVNNGC